MSTPLSPHRDLDLVLWGASGFTGRLVAERLAARHPPDSGLRWALGGRSRDKLEAVRTALGRSDAELPVVVADSRDLPALARVASGTRAIVTTVGPFARYGSDLVEACAAAGTHYADLAGEVQWVRRMIDAHEETARRTGARLVHCCGFDSIPSDLGCWVLQEEAQRRWGSPLERISNGVRKLRGGPSGGTIASLLGILDEARGDRAVRRVLGRPYSLNPVGMDRGPDGSDQHGARFDSDLGSWTAPFVMASVNSRVVRRSNALLGFAWGEEMRYRESSMTGPGLRGRLRATKIASVLAAFYTAASLRPTRALLERFALPAPGEGPDAAARERGGFEMILVGVHPEGRLRARVSADRDPGYGATSRMLSEVAALLSLEADRLPVEGGSWTPASAFGGLLVERLVAHAGMRFDVEEEPAAGAVGGVR